ncbi:hypothetical protein GGI20_001702 [Coemansia sp. BCRC 34301]|nr:hypothetical protein GGI20_001702 [Coemansia sp. BCRC 34301]
MNRGFAILQRQTRARVVLAVQPQMAAAFHRNGPAKYTSEAKKARELVKFPWIWPSEASMIPQRAKYLPRLAVSPILLRLTQWTINQLSLAYASLVFDGKYLTNVKDKMVGVVLQRIIEAINTCDYKALDELMTPPLAKVYKHSLANMRAQGYTLHINIKEVESSTIEALVVYLGKPRSFDVSIPVESRFGKYQYWISDSLVVSRPKTSPSDSSLIARILDPQVLLGALSDEGWRSVQYRFKVRADVEISLKSRGKVVDMDHDTMEIPLALSSPFYEDVSQFEDAVKHRESASYLEPFRWYVSDLFNISESSDHCNIKVYMSKAK